MAGISLFIEDKDGVRHRINAPDWAACCAGGWDDLYTGLLGAGWTREGNYIVGTCYPDPPRDPRTRPSDW